MSKFKSCYIFFDTNAFECRHSGDELYLYEVKASKLFYEIKEEIDNLGLSDNIHICISEMVFEEIKHHLVEKFKSARDSLLTLIENAKNSFGSLISILCEFPDVDSDKKYVDYVNTIAKEFMINSKNNVAVIPCPRGDEILNSLIQKAVKGIRPFVKIKSNNKKEYSDAGFKDALIWETMLSYIHKGMVIFVTKDSDFDINNKQSIFVCSNVSEVRQLLLKNMELSNNVLFISRLLNNDRYVLQNIMDASEFYDYDSIEVKTIMDKKIIYKDESVLLDVKSLFCVDNVDYIFKIDYDLNANEIMNAQYDSI